MFRKFTKKDALVLGALLSMFVPSSLMAGQFYEETAQGIISKLQEEPTQVQPVKQSSSSIPGSTVRLRSFPGSGPAVDSVDSPGGRPGSPSTEAFHVLIRAIALRKKPEASSKVVMALKAGSLVTAPYGERLKEWVQIIY